MAKKKVTRKQLLREPDQFLSFWERAYNYVLENSTMCATVALVVVGVGIAAFMAVFLYRMHIKSTRLAFNEALAQASEANSVEKKIDILKRYEQKQSASEMAAVASAELGWAYYQDGKYDAAAEAFNNALAWSPKSEGKPAAVRFRRAARIALAYAYEAQGKFREGIDVLLENEREKDAFLQQETRLHVARLYAAAGEVEKARSEYERFLSDFPDSSSSDMVKSRLSKLER